MDKTLSEPQRAQLDGIVQKMTQNGEPDHAIQFVVSDFKQKYGTTQKVGPNGTVVGGVAGTVVKNIIDQVKGNVKEASDSLTASSEGKMNPFQAGANIAKNTTEAVLSPLTQTVGKVISPVVTPVVNYAADKISDSPLVQKTASMYNPDVVKTVGDIVQTGVNVGGLATLGDTPSEIAAKAKGVASDLKTTLTPDAETSFRSKVNDALPVLKNDVRNLPKKYANAKTALTDIVDNKESLGFTDKSGTPRVPENFAETTQAQSARMKSIYQEYSAKLEGVDKQKFDVDIQAKIADQIESIKSQLEKENSSIGRKALANKLHELSSLRDTSPEGIQNYIESLNQEAKTAPGAPLSVKQIKAANLAGSMRQVLDSSIEKIDGQGYQDLRNLYGAHRAMQDQFLMAAKKEINNVPGLTSKLADLGVSAEGLNFLITHNPTALATAVGVKAASMLTKWFNSPQRALQGLYKGIENGTYRTQIK